MADRGLRMLPTGATLPVPVEFEQLFVRHGWHRVEHLFGKRAARRYFTVLGADRLRAERDAYLAERLKAAADHTRRSGVVSPSDRQIRAAACRFERLGTCNVATRSAAASISKGGPL